MLAPVPIVAQHIIHCSVEQPQLWVVHRAGNALVILLDWAFLGFAAWLRSKLHMIARLFLLSMDSMAFIWFVPLRRLWILGGGRLRAVVVLFIHWSDKFITKFAIKIKKRRNHPSLSPLTDNCLISTEFFSNWTTFWVWLVMHKRQFQSLQISKSSNSQLKF